MVGVLRVACSALPPRSPPTALFLCYVPGPGPRDVFGPPPVILVGAPVANLVYQAGATHAGHGRGGLEQPVGAPAHGRGRTHDVGGSDGVGERRQGPGQQGDGKGGGHGQLGVAPATARQPAAADVGQAGAGRHLLQQCVAPPRHDHVGAGGQGAHALGVKEEGRLVQGRDEVVLGVGVGGGWMGCEGIECGQHPAAPSASTTAAAPRLGGVQTPHQEDGQTSCHKGDDHHQTAHDLQERCERGWLGRCQAARRRPAKVTPTHHRSSIPTCRPAPREMME